MQLSVLRKVLGSFIALGIDFEDEWGSDLETSNYIAAQSIPPVPSGLWDTDFCD